jgi:hypothetical protein
VQRKESEVMSEQATVASLEDRLDQERRSVAELFAIGSWLVGQNADLPSPFSMCDLHPRTGQLSVQFAPEPESVPALVAWAQRLGGVIQAGTATSGGGERYRWCRVSFPFCGVQVSMWTHLPVPEPPDRQQQ